MQASKHRKHTKRSILQFSKKDTKQNQREKKETRNLNQNLRSSAKHARHTRIVERGVGRKRETDQRTYADTHNTCKSTWKSSSNVAEEVARSVNALSAEGRMRRIEIMKWI